MASKSKSSRTEALGSHSPPEDYGKCANNRLKAMKTHGD